MIIFTYVPDAFHSSMKLKVYVTIQPNSQLVTVTKVPADTFTFMGNICKRYKIFQPSTHTLDLYSYYNDYNLCYNGDTSAKHFYK